MGKFSDILLTVDFDRTLTARDSTIPRRNLEAIEYFMAEGGAFTVNTGRSVPMYSSLMNAVPVNAPLLLYNGSAAFDLEKKELLFATPIDLDWKEAVAKLREVLPDLTVEFQGVRHHYIFEENEMWKRFCIHNSCPWGYAGFEEDLGPFLKFSVYGEFRDVTVADLYQGSQAEIARMDLAEKQIADTFGSAVSVFRAGTRIIDIHAGGVSKGKSARRLQQELGRKILVCAGDAQNDLTMLQEADYAFIPADATISGFETVCECGEGAVADIIEKKLAKILG